MHRIVLQYKLFITLDCHGQTVVFKRHIFLSKIGGGKYKKKSHLDSLLVLAVYKPKLGQSPPASAFSS